MNILFLGDASNLHNTLAIELRRLGHKAVVASGGSGWMRTRRDIDIARNQGKLEALKYMFKLMMELPKMKGYDIVQINNPIFLDLRPQKVRKIFDYLKNNNGKIVMTALGTDFNYVNACISGECFSYSDYRVGDSISPYSMSKPDEESQWTCELMKEYTRYITDNISGIMACLYEYYKSYELLGYKNLEYAGIPIDVQSIGERYIESEPDKVKFLIGIQRNRSILKGTDIMLDALNRIVEKYPEKCKMDIVENLPYSQYIERLNDSHVLLDQLYSYTPATNALLAMARGRIAVSGAEPEYYEFIEEKENHPVINVSPIKQDDVYNKLEWIVKNKSSLPELSRKSREFVLKHNDSRNVAQRYIDFWQKI